MPEKLRNFSVKAFAISIGRHPNAITNMHQARFQVVSVKALTKIAVALGVDISEITLAGEDEPAEQTGRKVA